MRSRRVNSHTTSPTATPTGTMVRQHTIAMIPSSGNPIDMIETF